MEEIEKVAIEVEGNNYEVRVFRQGNSFSVRGFAGEKQVTPVYSVSFDTDSSFEDKYGYSSVEELKKICAGDIKKTVNS